jgi:hypothetical protein
MGTRQSPDFGPDYHWNSYVPHLLSGHDARGHPRHLCAPKGVQKPTTVGNLHPSRQSFGTTRRVRCSGSHLGSTLKPGGAVLTRGVFRRSGSVACIRVDASPNEVHTRLIMHDGYDEVNVICAVLPNLYAVITCTHSVWPASGVLSCADRRLVTYRPGHRGARWCR